MLGARLKSWMEAQLGRAKKRKQKPTRQTTPTTPVPPPHLSSPESAYSTGYSTDGTSPGAPPASLAAPLVPPPPPPTPPTTHLYHEPAKIVFGQNQCWVEIDGTRSDVIEVPNILPRHVYTKYWISWHSTRLQFGCTSDGIPLIAREIPVQDLYFVTFSVYADRGTLQWKLYLPPKLQKPFLKRVEGGDMHWVDFKDQLPDGALIGGYEKEILYIMRAPYRGSLTPGKIIPSKGAGFIAWGTVMLERKKLQVLCGYNCIWVSMCNNQIPVGAVEAGYCEDNHETLYIGRVVMDGNLIPGKVKPSHSVCFFPYNGAVYYTKEYEILVNPQITMHRYTRYSMCTVPQITMHRYLGNCPHRVSGRAVHSFTRYFVCTMDEITEIRPEAEEENVYVNIVWNIEDNVSGSESE